MFSRKENEVEKAEWEAYADKYIEGVEKLHKIGGFPVVVITVGVLLIFGGLLILLGSSFGIDGQEHIAKVLPFLIICGTILSLSGTAVHIFEVRNKEAAYQKSLDHYYSMVSQLWSVYTEKLKDQPNIDSSILRTTMTELHRVINHSEVNQD